MSNDNAPKTSFELAMERLRKQDADEGVSAQPLTDEQKNSIAEVRSLYNARIAEQDVLQQSAMKGRIGFDPTELDEVSRPFRRERERLASERDRKVEKIRRGEL
jgi:hypothetical protein